MDGVCICVSYQGFPFKAALWPFDKRIDVAPNIMFTLANFFIALAVALILWFSTKKILQRIR